MRILALDVGDRKIGIAVSDEFGWTAQGIETYYRKSSKNDIEYINALACQYHVNKIVVGLPKNMNGSLGPQADKVKEFTQSLSNVFDGEIVFWDERLTTVAAEKLLINADVNRKKRKLKIDKIAATYILQNYLDFNCKNTES